MNDIEKEIFKRSRVDYNKLLNYGFIEKDDNYTLEKDINDSLKVIIEINQKGFINGKIIDKDFNEEYINHKTKIEGKYSNTIKDKYKELLLDIRDHCFITYYFMYNQSNRIVSYIKNKYNTNPEFLWEKYPMCGIFRNINTNKWFSLITNVNKNKLDNKTEKEVEIINVKIEKELLDKFLKVNGFYKAYHMNKKNWITIILDDTVPDFIIFKLIDMSYNLNN